MKLFIDHDTFFETNDPIDLSIGISSDGKGPLAWYLDPPKMTPVMENGFVGSISQGGAVNFRNITFNPHGHGTHTESYGHIADPIYPVSNCFTGFFFHAVVISIIPEIHDGDQIITKNSLLKGLPEGNIEALVVRTLPNDLVKKSQCYSNTNPAYMNIDCIPLLNERGVKHLLVDLPSVDREEDEGVLAFHHAFWNVPNAPDTTRTITELIFIPDSIKDGTYILELQVANFENDAAPSRPVLYKKRKEA